MTHPTRWLLALVVWLCAPAAWSQTLPFVEPGGMIRGDLRYSQVVATLGDPPVVRVKWQPGDPGLAGSVVFEYPAQGLGFVVPAHERSEPDPRVVYMVVRPPATALTPEGIRIGMSLAAVRTVIRAGDAVPKGSTLVWTGSTGTGARPAQLRFGAAQTLELMVFDTGLPPAGAMAEWRETARVVVAGLLLVLALLALPWLLKGFFQREKALLQVLAPRHRAIGTGMLVLAPVVAVLGGLVVAVGDGSMRLLGILMLLGGAGLVLAGAYNHTLAAELKLRWLGVALLLFFAVVMALNTLLLIATNKVRRDWRS